MKKLCILITLLVVAFALSANADMTYKAFFNKGPRDIDPDYPGTAIPGMENWKNDASSWIEDNGLFGYMDLHPEAEQVRGMGLYSTPSDLGVLFSQAGGTVKFWYHPTTDPVFTATGKLWSIEDWAGVSPQPVIGGEWYEDRVSFFIRPLNNLHSPPNNPYTLTAPVDLIPCNWYHIAMVFDCGQDIAQIYINGQLEASGAMTDLAAAFNPADYLGTGEARFYIGGFHKPFPPETENDVAEGGYDQFEMYNTPLSASEIYENYAQGRIVPEPSMMMLLGTGLLFLLKKRS
jgi:hypothetical protein